MKDVLKNKSISVIGGTGSFKKKFSVVRYGNSMMLRGSVIPLFIKQSKTEVITLTHKRMTRFSIALDQRVNFLIRCLNRMWGGELFLPKLHLIK